MMHVRWLKGGWRVFFFSKKSEKTMYWCSNLPKETCVKSFAFVCGTSLVRWLRITMKTWCAFGRFVICPLSLGQKGRRECQMCRVLLLVTCRFRFVLLETYDLPVLRFMYFTFWVLTYLWEEIKTRNMGAVGCESFKLQAHWTHEVF